ncbi:Fanconi anemia group G protein [Aulostomus maculatus]
MSNKVSQPSSLLDRWTLENDELVKKLKRQQEDRDAISRDQNQSSSRLMSSEFQRLLRKIQGLPPLVDHMQLELSVLYNAGLYSVVLSQVPEAELLLTQTLERILQMTGDHPLASDPLVLWRTVLQSVGNTVFNSCVLHLLCLQWAVWLATCRLELIQEFKGELSSLSAGVGDDEKSRAKGKSSITPLLVMDPRRLIEILQICTIITQSAERLNEGLSSEALTDLQSAPCLSAPRTLVAYTHLLSGSCLAHMSRPQMALQCFRKALETDSSCISALYQSMLIYKHLGNTHAETQALRLLHSTLMMPSATESGVAGAQLLSPSSLLHSQSLRSLLSVPSALTVLHSLALKSVLHGRVSEGVDYYLDLLAALHSEHQQAVPAEAAHLPRLPELYLEAGSALLMVQRPVDCMTLCDEVITTTLELLPERVVLEEEEEGGDRVMILLWTGAAYLLQGHCYTHLKDWKQAVIHYTRCINLLVKVCFKQKGCKPQILSTDMVDKQRRDMCFLQRLKGLSLACRGISFTQTDQLREALRDLQLSLQAVAESERAGLWCGEVLWRLGRRREAAACWEKTLGLSAPSSVERVPVYLQEPQSGPVLDSTELRHRIQELGST